MPSHGILSVFVFILLSLTTAASLPIPDASVFQQAFQQPQVPRADAVHHDNADSFSALGLEDQLRLQQERLQQMHSQGRVAQAVEISNNVAILQQQIARRPKSKQGRMSVIEQLAESRSNENTVANEIDKIQKLEDPLPVTAADIPVAVPQEAFIIKVETVRYNAPVTAAPAAPLVIVEEVIVVDPLVPEVDQNVIDLQDAEGQPETSTTEQTPAPVWREYEDVVVYSGCVLAMAAVLYVLSVAVHRRQKLVEAAKEEDSPTTTRCPDVFQKVWAAPVRSLTLRNRNLPRVTSNHVMTSPTTVGPNDDEEEPFGECHVGLQNRILSNFETTNESYQEKSF